MDLSNVFVCSFFTDDSYYRDHADALRTNLDRLGIAHGIEMVQKEPGEQWPDICRKKIPFLAGACERNPDKKVFWIDVDCQLLDFPDFLAGFSADVIGFQRGFGSPLGIGYHNRTRFWEPCFFGINTSHTGRKFIRDAAELEANGQMRATDDYFFEESWRANAPHMSFQVIPSVAVVSRAETPVEGVPVFFSFGASGRVAEFKGQVLQHGHLATGSGPKAVGEHVRRQALRGARSLRQSLPDRHAQRLRRVADSTGITHLITGAGAGVGPLTSAALGGGSAHRQRIVEQMLGAAQRGEVEVMNDAWRRLTSSAVPTHAETLMKQACDSYASYAMPEAGQPSIALAWWPRPFPGNFGDWLSPLVVSEVSGRAIRYVSPTGGSPGPHLVAVGSIGRFIKSTSVVVGTGISNTDQVLATGATYVSLRGPVTADVLQKCGGPAVESFGDPGALLSRLLPVDGPDSTNGRLALVRHFTHANVPLLLPDDVDELGVLTSHRQDVEKFVRRLHDYDGVITSAMHVMIACHSYGIPCALVTFKGFEPSVHGSGIKYEDYSRGVELDSVHVPAVIGTDLRQESLRDRLSGEKISSAKLDEIHDAVRAAIELVVEQQAV